MRKRDLAVLLLAAFAVFYSVQHEGGLHFKQAWYIVGDEPGPFAHESEKVPLPLVTDLNGDGRNEIVVATHDAKIQVYKPRVAGHDDDSFFPARLLAEVSLLPEHVRIQKGRRAVAMAAGYLQRKVPKMPRKQAIVVVTAGWHILCYDSNLRLIWDQNVQEHFPHGAHIKEIAIVVSNYSMRAGDLGSVIVGGSMEVVPEEEWNIDNNEEEDVEKLEEAHSQAGNDKEELEDLTDRGIGGLERHFSYYAFDGRSGKLRWHHNSTDFRRAALRGDPSSALVPQHNYKLDANALLGSRHIGEHDCRDYRWSVLGSLPHSWDHRPDTKFELAHFRKMPKGLQKKHGGAKKIGDPHKRIGKELGNAVTRTLEKVVGAAKGGSTGAKVRNEIRDSFYRPTHVGNKSGHWWAPNTIVAHLSDGIEAIHLYTGRPICRMNLPSGGLHADVNDDGVIDHVQVAGGHGGEVVFPTGMDEALKPCWAIATTGMPVREQLFNGSVCADRQFASRFAFRTEGSTLTVARPVLLPRNKVKKHRTVGGGVLFLTSRGDVTAFAVENTHMQHQGRHAKKLWQIRTEATWQVRATNEDSGDDGVADHFFQPVPTIHVMASRVGGPQDVIVVAGENAAVFITPFGATFGGLYLPSLPTEELQFADFNNDGLTDIILVSGQSYYGFQQRRSPGMSLFSAALGVLILIMIGVLIVQHISHPKKPRSSGRADS
ncbi:hypothetical protein CBR_g41477 [Chara braunii]|uniref:FG-GAP repeat-containing protein n=1 Tax=Chara braunii TaxID=69332 RepID=A0A388LW87_CHABU|nr:hypothetical protein CBR_g41477 [Chara braunii]|eukprot:GBG86482.1 hypothetical protein CBR_g41477 [Chara braunii]